MEWRWVVEAGQPHCGKGSGEGKGYRFMSFQGAEWRFVALPLSPVREWRGRSVIT